ncbi:fimbrial protein [Pseudomonas sp. H9]|uniref:fimbrial protein n=1 Tax=Pseudomonas sp. H9 TaxID=483968 RepID=UPI001057EDD8|nr:fimbrial protein [Pseudomonas sp. H9]TDF81590.1 type 1 fimbrial protein [Pseudomonas sp. H9]
MKASKKSLLALAGCLLLGVGLAQADGQMSFNGSVYAGTCEVNGGHNDVAVSLPPVPTSQLINPGQVAGYQRFNLRLTNCSPGLNRVSTYFEPGPTISPQGRLIVDAGGSENVEVQLRNDTNAPMNLAGAQGNQNSQIVDITSGRAVLNYSAEYYSLGGTTPGPVNTRVQYTLIYP